MRVESESCVGAAASPCKSSVEDVPLRAKPAINFHDAVFYYPPDQTADDHEDGRRRPAPVLSEGRVPATAAACCSCELPLKEAVSVGDDTPLMGGGGPGSRRRPSVLRRMRAFFARSAGDVETAAAAERKLSAADASSAVWTELDEAQSVPAAVGGGGIDADTAVTARPAHSDTSPPPTAGYMPPDRGAEHLTSVAAAGEQACDSKTTSEDDQLVRYSCQHHVQP